MPTAKRTLAVLTAAAMLLVLVPTAAHAAAGRVSKSGSTLIYDGSAGADSLSVEYNGTNYTFSDMGNGVEGFAGCTAPSSYWGSNEWSSCPGAGITALLIRLHDGDDTGQIEVGTTLPGSVTLTVYLGGGSDSWQGSRATAETVYGGTGNDSMIGYGGNDRLLGEDGTDTMDGDAGDDRIEGGAGNDDLFGRDGNDVVLGGGGNDEVFGERGTDTVRGGGGDDVVSGGLGTDGIYGDAGHDRLLDDHRGQHTSFLSPDTLIGGRGRDTADYSYRLGEATPLRLSLDGRRNDGARNEGDLIATSVENIIGGIDSDVIKGNKKSNLLAGRQGDDLIKGQGGADGLYGESGHDGLAGGPGSDLLDGWYGRDTLSGGGGRDVLRGGPDADDLISRDSYKDKVACGSGIDRAAVDVHDRVSSLCNVVVVK